MLYIKQHFIDIRNEKVQELVPSDNTVVFRRAFHLSGVFNVQAGDFPGYHILLDLITEPINCSNS